MRFSLIKHLLFSVALIVLAAGGSHAEAPGELAEYAADAGCEPGASGQPGMVEPSYLYGYQPGWGEVPEGEREKNVVFWCRKKGAERVYQLVIGRTKNSDMRFTLAESRKLSLCPAVVEWPASRSGPPGGLAIGRRMGVPLRGFQTANLPFEPDLEGEYTTHQSLRSRYDGSGWAIYCHDGAWLVRGRR